MSNIVAQNENKNKQKINVNGELIDIKDLIRFVVEKSLNEIMSEQADQLVEDGNYRNGYRERMLNTTAGTLNLKIPKLRMGTYFPDQLLTRYSRSDLAIISSVREMVVNGISTRKVERVANKMGVLSMSSSQISRICKGLDEEVENLQKRVYGNLRFPYLWLDATYLTAREDGHVRSFALVTAVAAGTDGYKHLVGVNVVDTESYGSWAKFLRSLKSRGVTGVSCVVSDAHEGLKRAIKEIFVGASWQRCIVHLMRNVVAEGTTKKQRAIIGNILSSVFKEENPQVVRELYRQACIKIRALNKAAGEILEESEHEALVYLDFPQNHRKRLRTNNVQERLNREIKRRSRVVQVFPDRNAALRLVGAVLAEIEEKWHLRRWFNDISVLDAYEPKPDNIISITKEELDIRCTQTILLAEKQALDKLGVVA